jgi:hypothetical protein
VFEAVKAGVPELAEIVEHSGSRVQRLRLETAVVHATTARSVHEARTLEHTDVLRNGLERDAERLGQLGNRAFSLGYPTKNAAACLVREGMKDAVDLRRASLKHNLEYLPGAQWSRSLLTIPGARAEARRHRERSPAQMQEMYAKFGAWQEKFKKIARLEVVDEIGTKGATP